MDKLFTQHELEDVGAPSLQPQTIVTRIAAIS